jgi:hypothetical protein
MSFMRVGMALCVTLLFAAVPASAQLTPVSQPDASYVASTGLVAITATNLTDVTTITNGSQTVTFSSSVNARTVPGGGWATWAAPPATESATPRVLYSTATSLTLTLSTPANGFGFEIEPNAGTQTFTVSYMNGATTLGTVTVTPTGTSGALLAAAYSSTPVTSVVITAPAGGFAIAQVRYVSAAVPALGTYALAVLGMLLMVGLVVTARRQRGAAAHS